MHSYFELMCRKNTIRSVNWHITSRCNYSCRFCFMKNLKDGFAEILNAERILLHVWDLGIEKINFAGGEPLLYPLLYDIVKISKEIGFVTSITTNGSLLNSKNIEILSPYLDWIALSVDSGNEDIERKLGRGCRDHIKHVSNISKIINDRRIKLKINTTVTKLNYKENMKPFISKLNPDRWKNFQVLFIKGQNGAYINQLMISEEEFNHYIDINKDIILKSGVGPVFEKSNDMLDSYFMLSPTGNVLLNSNNEYKEYPLKLLNNCKDIENLLSTEKYELRGGNYQWN